MTISSDEILAGLDPEQREVATSIGGPVCVLAGAGTGKTRAITHRIAYGVVSGQYNPAHVLALTFTAKAAAEMRSRLRGLGSEAVSARTFHAAALRQLRYFWPQAIGGAMPNLISSKVPAVAETCRRLHLSVDKPALRDIVSELEWAKVSMVLPEDYPRAARAAGREGVAGFDPISISRIIGRYEDVKADNNVIDFDDVLLLLHGILNDKPEIAHRVRGQYRHLVVDEYQDVSPLQQQLLKVWLGTSQDLCVVGDAAQTIYSFAGARSHYLTSFTKEFPSARIIKLERNYRSTPQIVSAANTVLEGASTRLKLRLASQRESGIAPTVTAHADDVAEAQATAEAISGLIAQGHSAQQMAILFRTNAQSEAFENALAERGINYLVRGGEKFFQRQEVMTAMTALRTAANVAKEGQDLVEFAQDILSSVGWKETAPPTAGAARERWEALQALVGLAQQVAERPGGGTVQDYLAELHERAEAQNAPGVDGVTLASIHTAKGLEWDVVFVVGASEGLLPISLAKDDEAVEEERRLFYVALTRARDVLRISWSRSRTPGGRASRKQSRFLDTLAPESAPSSGRGRGKKTHLVTACKNCGSNVDGPARKGLGLCEDCAPEYDEALFARLREWRKSRAEEDGVPAYVVCNNSVLGALAQHRPGTLDELMRVPGIGSAKAERYGSELLKIVAGE
ncbi:ATP-dependent DNA helicase UvrD2 [Dermabacteraceae bacterium P13138]